MPTSFRVVAVFVILGLLGHARAQETPAAARVEQLNKRAMGDYDLLEFDSARRTLNEALVLIKKSGLDTDPVAARTYLNLGVVYVAGLKDRYKGFQQFVKGLQIKPEAQLDPAIATPELQEVFENARETVGVPRGGKGSAGQGGAKKEGAPPPPGGGETPPNDGAASVSGLIHKTIDEAPRGQPISVIAQVGADVSAARVLLFYRPPDREDFAIVPM